MPRNILKMMLPTVSLLLLASPGLAWDAPDNGRRPPEPPPEAYRACKDKAEGDRVEMQGPHGEFMKAVCRKQGDCLIAVPSGRPPAPQDRD